jgi:alpha-beta hydrolase superfamily lysophospholipase
VTPRLVVSMLDQGESALAGANRISVPTLLLVAGSDLIVDQDITLEFADDIQSGLATLHTYPKLFHEVFNEIPPDRKVVFQDFDRWLRLQLGLSPASSEAAG